ncbi:MULTISPECIES: VOC family protein [Chryseobacterium]|uniref:PhnB protein n=1 Tax=Chryseobacterium camelliae TaxID=1265445 RepID=A0ABU0TK52_9FLAO|nr:MULTISPECIES: VOC family protein [Chryseobacterium]MDT3409534.1 PhnB protein [Pseudacidovorax intermedius]MDQ1096603.1 PhnB protein [Chryseobacterium camelliae]MDQ1100544.1 PhnB protein [Chryseobacterium sp. SORGH_AS_1048]MDR6087885.1 PhnB protein [Chryseobacterium sp. SORGH_AS_0909]MDR6132260.1 PhnB protein [Chryseobacterium sp. SORGH_AS_1175]
MATVNVYLTFNGNCREAFDFYKSVFGGEFQYIGTFGDMPPSDDNPVPDEDKDGIMHVTLPISTETVLMGSDTGSAWSSGFVQGNNVAVSINTESQEEADRLFYGLSEGGQVTMPIAGTFWGAYFGMFADQFGIHWMVNYDDPSKAQQHP